MELTKLADFPHELQELGYTNDVVEVSNFESKQL